ncbi:MAG TPA: transcriptional regulator, partial [Burkholderiales bacterium]|nr:transcriptional regulator [Burkholderiales bacterium]
LAKLVRGGLLAAEVQGRHRYFRLANPEVAEVVESMASLGVASRPRAPRPPLPSPEVPVEFLHARTCYEHLAGKTAVKILESMLKERWLAADGRDFTVTPLGGRKLGALGVDLAQAHASRRVFARTCVDLTERRAHLGGALGEALLRIYLDRGWILRQRRSRIVHITPKGRESFRDLFGA